MNKEDLVKEVIESNLSSEAKLEVMKLLFAPYQPIIQQQPIIIKQIEYPSTNKDWWKDIEVIGSQEPTLWDDTGWWQQHLRDAQVDVESIIRPNITC